VLEQLGSRMSFGVTELERFADCSSAWFVERFLDPKTIDAAARREAARQRRAQRPLPLLHPRPGRARDREARAAAPGGGTSLMRECLDEAVSRVRMDLTEMQERELHQTLWRDLSAFVEEECESSSPLVPRRFEVAFGSERAAPELQRGLELGGG
jgi:hypothetical protein